MDVFEIECNAINEDTCDEENGHVRWQTPKCCLLNMPGLPKLTKVHRSHSRLPDEKLRDLENWIDSVASSSRFSNYNNPALQRNGFPGVDAIVDGTDDGSSIFDSDQDDHDDVAMLEAAESTSLKVYRKMCDKLGIPQMRTVWSQFGNTHLSFKDLFLSSKGVKATCCALMYEPNTEHLDLSGNHVGKQQCHYLVSILEQTVSISILDLSNNELSGTSIQKLARCLVKNGTIITLTLSGNKLTDGDAEAIARIITENCCIIQLYASHNEFREEGGKVIGSAIGRNRTLVDLDLSWNHLRRAGAIGISRGLEVNRSLKTVNLSWNGFGFEGSVAIGDMLTKNSTLLSLDISSNRINPPAVLELMRGLTKNKVLQHLKLGHNPITAAFSSVMLEAIKKSPHVALQSLDLEGIVVDKEFESLITDINTSRHLEVTYEISLPIAKQSRDKMLKELELPQSFNIDPLRMLHLLKEKNRAQDFFRKINKDDDDGLTRDELSLLFKEAGIPVTVSVIDKIMEFMDTNGDGTIDMAEFLVGDRKITKISRNQEQTTQSLKKRDAHYTKYSRTFRKAHIDPKNFSLKVEESNNHLAPLEEKPSELRTVQWEQIALNK